MASYSRNSLRVRLARNAHTRGEYVRNSFKAVRRTGFVQSRAVRTPTLPLVDDVESNDEYGNLAVFLVHFVSTCEFEEKSKASVASPVAYNIKE